MIGLSIQPHKCVAWSHFGLLFDFNAPSQFTTPSKRIRILGVPLGTSSFTSSFIKDALLEDVWHVDLLPKMGDVQVAFGILTHCFMQWPSYLLRCTPPSSTFIESFTSFDFSFLQLFGHLLGPKSFENLKRPLACKQTFLLKFFGGIGFILTTIITLIAYLGSWAFVASIIVAKFMIDQRPYLLEALSWVDNNTFPFSNTLRCHVISYHPLLAHVFFCLNNSSNNKWFDFKIPSWSIYTIIPFPACFWIGYLKPIVPKFYHVLAQGRVFGLQFD